VTPRIGGGLQVIGGFATGLASRGLIAVGAVACPETLGAGCAAALLGASGMVWSADQVSSGLITVATGRATPTLGGKLVSNILGVSEGAGELINGVLGLSPLAVEAALANGIIKIPVAVSKADASAGTVGANIISESAINPALALRLDLYKASKADNGVVGASSKGNTSSNFSDFTRREALVREALAANQSPWPLGYTPVIRSMDVGEQFNIVISTNQAKGLSGPGGWATFSPIPNQNFARETLAITEQFKQDVSFVQRFEVVQPFNAHAGPIGPQIDQVTGPSAGGRASAEMLRQRTRIE
jgi:hypothetical protein